ncbi:glycosyl hydrolase family 28-related protein [Palleronia rufa]|uniref:glycosyl hydrolase family 28-related protein n=1 Tax=Palleronia rufa TaxID=1530186 RepID=UPI000560D767|nr:glycosyl hydrolase family 28-related protein [Palleronia rufa]
MNKVITEGLVLMPTPFASGLNLWSKGDGTAGSPTYASDPDAYFVPADQDFGGALELFKTDATQKLRYMKRTPIIPGCYLRVTARVKVIAGSIPAFRIAGWAGRGGDVHVPNLDEAGPSVVPTRLGQVVEVSAIVGSGVRGGVDMSWGSEPEYGYLGLDMTGPSGGVVRIDDLTIEDVTTIFIADMLPIVDVRDFGARGDGVTDDSAAFNAADVASNGREIIVPKGTYRLNKDVFIDTRIRFEGTVVQPRANRFVLRKNFDLPSYIDAFGDEVEAFKKAFQALLNNADHESLDMGGRRIELDGPIDMAAASAKTVFEIRRVIRNGQFNIKPGAGWTPAVATSAATYDPAAARRLTDVANAGSIQVGAQVTGQGVGREVYVRAVDRSAGVVDLSAPLWGGAGRRTYTFTRYRYVLDFSGFSKLSKFTIDNVEFQMNGEASGILLAQEGETFHLKQSFMTKMSHKGLTSIGRGCQDLQVDNCHFVSDEQALPATRRVTVGFNVNANDAKIRSNRFQRLGTSMVLDGQGHLIVGNHWFQGDEVTDGPRVAGLVFTLPNNRANVCGNYIDNCFIEWTNEHDPYPDFFEEFSFGGLVVTGNTFVGIDTARYFSWIVVKPHGKGHFIHGFSVTNNVFRNINGTNARAERIDTSIADLDRSRYRMIEWTGNTYNNVDQETINPVTLEFTQNTAEQTWTLDPSRWLPFDGWTRTVTSVAPVGRLRDAGGATVFEAPAVDRLQGTAFDRLRLHFSKPVRGTVQVTIRCDRPY